MISVNTHWMINGMWKMVFMWLDKFA